MAVVTTVTPADISTALGRPAPSSAVEEQWEMWIADAEMLINHRIDELGASDPDQVKVDYVVREAVVAHVRHPEDATNVTVSVDDASTSRTYRSGRGRVQILDEWWLLLGLARGRGRAFELDTMPADALARHGVDYWWSTPTDKAPM